MKKTLLIAIFLATIFCEIQWELGESNKIKGGTKHVLEQDQGKPRFMDVRVEFKDKFKQVPQVVLGVTNLAWSAGTGADFKVKLLDADTAGFSYRVSTSYSKAFSTCFIKYLAFVDPHILADTYEFKVYNVNGQQDKTSTIQSIEFERAYEATPNISVFLLGAKWNEEGDQVDINLEVANPTTKGFNLDIQTLGRGNPYSVFVQVVATPQTQSQVEEEDYFSKKVASYSDKKIKRLASKRRRSVRASSEEFSIDKEYMKKGLTFYAFSGFTAYNIKKFNLFFYKSKRYVPYNEKKQTLKLEVKGDSLPFLTNYAYDIVSYIPQDDCAFLFTGCNFSGEAVEICKDKAKNTFIGTTIAQNDVKSMYVPETLTLNLYGEENLQGDKYTFEETKECIEEIVPEQ